MNEGLQREKEGILKRPDVKGKITLKMLQNFFYVV